MNKLKVILPFLVFLLSFGVYVFTLNPSISAADSNEMVTTAIVLGIPHQPSYPVNTLLGFLFSKIPFGPLPWRVNLMSAVLQAGTVTLVYFVILKLFSLSRDVREVVGEIRDIGRIGGLGEKLLAASAALFLAFSLEFWQFATRAEVFPLNNFFAATLTLIGLWWWKRIKESLGGSTSSRSSTEVEPQNPIPSSPPSRKTLQKYSFLTKHLPEEALKRWGAWQPAPVKAPRQGLALSLKLLYLFTFVSGLAFTHHQTIVLLAPAFLFLLLAVGGVKLWWKREVLVKLILVFLLGVLPYFSLIPLARANPPIQWGEPGSLKGVFKALARSDYGTFSPYAQHPSQIEGQPQKETPVTQQLFYLRSLNRDFTFWGLLLAALGAFYLARQGRKIFLFLALAFFFTGPFFFGFANYTLESGFHQAVTKRFQMLPDLYFALFLAFGLFFLWEKFQGLNLDLRERKNLVVAVLLVGGLSLTFIFPLWRNFKNADNRDNFLTIRYARDMVAPTPKNAIILISGDVTTFAFEYWRTIVEPGDERIIFSPGLLYLDWYVNRLKKNYPEIVIPPTLPGRIQPSTTQIVEANFGKRPIYISPELSRYDPEVEEKYVLWPKHLLFLVKQKGEDLRLESYRAENEALWQSYDFSLFEKIRKNNPLLEYAMVPEYARHHFNSGAVFESVKLYEDAIREYNRALKIHPGFPDPYKNLGRVYGFRLKEKDYQKAFENFNMFLATALSSQQGDVEAVKGAMGELYEEMVKEATHSASSGQASSASGLSASQSGQRVEATEAGKIATPSATVASGSAEATNEIKEAKKEVAQ